MASYFSQFARKAWRLAPLALLPYTYMNHQAFFWGGSKLKPNQMENRVHTAVI